MADRSLQTRTQLLAAARSQVLAVGYHGTTLRDIAKQADVPPGNIFYHFPTKESLMQSLLELEMQQLQVQLDSCAQPGGRDSLVKYLDQLRTASADLIAHGCPHSVFFAEASRINPSLAELAARMLKAKRDWFESRFIEWPKEDPAAAAFGLLVQVQGIIQGARALGNAEFLEAKLGRIVL